MSADFTSNPPPTNTEPPKPAWLAEALADWDRAKNAVSIDAQAGDIPAHLNAELIDFPSTIARWGFRVAEAIREMQLAEMAADDAHGAAMERVKDKMGPLKRGEVSNSDYEREARHDPEWRQAELRRIHAEAKVGRLKSVMAGLQAKKDALVSLGANLRSEIQADPSLRETPRDRDNARASNRDREENKPRF